MGFLPFFFWKDGEERRMGAAVGRYFHTLPGFSMDGGRGWREKGNFKGSDSLRICYPAFLKSCFGRGPEGHGQRGQISDGNKIPCPHSFEREEELT